MVEDHRREGHAMKAKLPNHPLEALSRSEKRRWRTALRRALKEHEADQLTTLREFAAAGSGVTIMSTWQGLGLTDSIEMIIDGWRVRGARVHRPTAAALREALASIASVPLAAASRYGPYWVLTFKTATEPLVVLMDRLTILPERGEGRVETTPTLQLAR
jgi:hypothetical protein